MKRFFITSSGTDIGKTLVTTGLCSQLRIEGKKVAALKPVASGFNVMDEESDTARISRSLGMSADAYGEISPWRFAAPLAPSMAAALEGQEINLTELVAFCQRTHDVDVLLVEGAGGVMAPLTSRHTMLDWMEALGWPVILVVGNYLGALSHTLTAVETLRSRGLKLQAVIVSESSESSVSLEDTLSELTHFITAPLIKIPRLSANSAIEHAMPSLTRCLEL